MSSNNVLALLASVGIALSAVALVPSSAVAEPPKDAVKKMDKADKGDKADKKADKKAESPVAIGDKAPAFALTDTDGKTHNLADFKDKIIVLEWYNAGCPFIVKHHKDATTFNDLHKDFSDKGVVFLAICSSGKGLQGHGLEFNKKSKNDFNLPFPILIDEDSSVARLYGAKTTPHCFIINKDGTLAYNGAIDNNKSGAENKNYVRIALDQMLRGETVTEATTRPYGCSVKYAGK